MLTIVFQRFASIYKPSAGVQRGERAERGQRAGLGWGKSCVCSASAMLLKMPRPCKLEPLVSTRKVFPHCICISGHGGRVQRTSLVGEKTRDSHRYLL